MSKGDMVTGNISSHFQRQAQVVVVMVVLLLLIFYLKINSTSTVYNQGAYYTYTKINYL